MANAILGMSCVLARNTGTFAVPVWVTVGNVRDVTVSLTKAEADATVRNNNGFKASKGTLKDLDVKFEMVADRGDTNYLYFRDSFLNDVEFEVAAADGIIVNVGTSYFRFWCTILEFGRNEPLTDVVKVPVSVKPAYNANPPILVVT